MESAMGSSAAGAMNNGILHVFFWWVIDAPCAAFGAYRGYKVPLSIEPDFRDEPRELPRGPWYLKRWAIMLLYGPLIFATIFYEFEVILDSVWRSFMVYTLFGILFTSMLLLAISVASLSIVVTYKGLCHQNYDWWWNSFCLGASGGLYMWLYSIYFMLQNEDLSLLGADLVYFCTMTMISSCFGVMCGAIAVLASYLFVERIYHASSKGQFMKF